MPLVRWEGRECFVSWHFIWTHQDAPLNDQSPCFSRAFRVFGGEKQPSFTIAPLLNLIDLNLQLYKMSWKKTMFCDIMALVCLWGESSLIISILLLLMVLIINIVVLFLISCLGVKFLKLNKLDAIHMRSNGSIHCVTATWIGASP